MRKIHRSPVNFPHKGQWRGALMSALIYVWINGWVNNREAGDLRRYRDHSDVIVMNPPVTDMFPLQRTSDAYLWWFARTSYWTGSWSGSYLRLLNAHVWRYRNVLKIFSYALLPRHMSASSFRETNLMTFENEFDNKKVTRTRFVEYYQAFSPLITPPQQNKTAAYCMS